jgi:tellurite resistance protein
MADISKQMNKFKEDLQKIISKQPQFEDTDSNKIILNSEKLKENSEFDLKLKEKNK